MEIHTFAFKLFVLKQEELLLLILETKEKKQKAQTKLINYFWAEVFSFVLRKVQDENFADEITVSVFSKVLAKIDLYDPQFQFKTWVLSIAQNTIIDHWRKRNKEENSSIEDLKEVRNHFARSPEELLISKQEQQKIFRTVASMEANYQKIIELRFFEEKSIKEIAHELKISESNTKVRIMRAKKILASLLKIEPLENE